VTVPWRLIDDLDSGIDAAGQMAADGALLEDVATGAAPALRLYRWDAPALSLGRFQPDDDVDRDACARLGVDVVRRPTGGRGLLHGGDLTYAVAMPRPAGPAGKVTAVYERLAAGLVAGLAALGVDAAVARNDGPAGPVCFASQQGADLRVGTRKVCGSAQVRAGGAVLQHGSILLDRLPFDETDLLAGGPVSPATGPGERRAHLRRATVTLAELGAQTDPHVVGAMIVEGFRVALDVEFSSRVDLWCR
jgi:lipoyl(octanoyl) transferase